MKQKVLHLIFTTLLFLGAVQMIAQANDTSLNSMEDTEQLEDITLESEGESSSDFFVSIDLLFSHFPSLINNESEGSFVLLDQVQLRTTHNSNKLYIFFGQLLVDSILG